MWELKLLIEGLIVFKSNTQWEIDDSHILEVRSSLNEDISRSQKAMETATFVGMLHGPHDGCHHSRCCLLRELSLHEHLLLELNSGIYLSSLGDDVKPVFILSQAQDVQDLLVFSRDVLDVLDDVWHLLDLVLCQNTFSEDFDVSPFAVDNIENLSDFKIDC